MNAGIRIAIHLLALAASLPMATAAADGAREFETASMAKITARHCGRGPFALALWSLECPHCKDSLKSLEKLRRQHPDVGLVLIQVDATEQASAGEEVLNRLGIHVGERWIFADEAPERLRYAVDRQWAGELPRTYLYRKDCERSGISGALKADVLRAWLRDEQP
jgi:hypothetical protein